MNEDPMNPDPQNRVENGMRQRLRMPGGRSIGHVVFLAVAAFAIPAAQQAAGYLSAVPGVATAAIFPESFYWRA
jgi:hypothetical protein